MHYSSTNTDHACENLGNLKLFARLFSCLLDNKSDEWEGEVREFIKQNHHKLAEIVSRLFVSYFCFFPRVTHTQDLSEIEAAKKIISSSVDVSISENEKSNIKNDLLLFLDQSECVGLFFSHLCSSI